MAKAKKRQKQKKVGTVSGLKRGQCRVVRGSVRVCLSKAGKITVSTTAKRKRRKTTAKRRKTTAKQKASTGLKKLKKPVSCETSPRVRKGVCKCKTKAGKTKSLRIAYCRAPKRRVCRRK